MTSAFTAAAADADAALKPFGIRVTPWGNSKTKFCVSRGNHGNETMLKAQIAELIQVRQQYG